MVKRLAHQTDAFRNRQAAKDLPVIYLSSDVTQFIRAATFMSPETTR
jgi:hypothetical protein